MGGRVWTLTQTEDSLWYNVYRNQESPQEESDKIRITAVNEKVNHQKGKTLQGVLKKEEEEEQPVSAVHSSVEEQELLKDYFQLNVKLQDLYKKWAEADPHFRHIADIFTGY